MSTEQAKQLTTDAADYARTNQFDKAVDSARQALELDTRSSDAYSVLGVALSKLGRIEEATDAFQRAVQTNSYSARNYYNLGMHYYGMGQKNDAISMCQEAIRCDGKHRGAHELLKKLESETHVEVAPYTTSLGDQRGSAYHYKKGEKKNEEPPPF